MNGDVPESPTRSNPNDRTREELPIADCQEKLSEEAADDGMTGLPFVSACLVRVKLAHIEVCLPLVNGDGSLSDRALRIEERLTTDTLAILPLVRRLPVKSLSHEDVAVVTRSSLERLVKAARAFPAFPESECVGLEELTRRSETLAQALVPFAYVGVSQDGAA